MDKRSFCEDLPAALHKWAVEEMKFQNDMPNKQIPTKQDFAEICKGEMAAVWKFIIRNTYSAQFVKKVKGNLLIKQKEAVPYIKAYKVKYGSDEYYSEEKADLYDRRRALIAQIRSVRTVLEHLEKDVMECHEELADIEQTYQQTVNHLRDEKRKAALLHVHSQLIQQEIDKLNEFSKRINVIIQNLQESSSKSATEEKYFHHGTVADPQRSMESTSTKEVRACCQSVCAFLHKMLQGSFGTDTSHLGQHKNKFWTEVESVVRNNSASQIMHSLLMLTREACYTLQDKTARIDIKKDAERLRFKYAGAGQLSDIAKQPSLLKSIHQLLENHQAQQIKNFMETEKYHNQTQKLQTRLKDIQRLRDETLAQNYRNQDPAVLELIKIAFETELKIATTHAAINCLVTVRDSLKEKISLSLREKETLHDKYQKIQGFQKVADGKQNLIRVLVKQNLDARARLENQQTQVMSQAAKAFDSEEEALFHLSETLKNSIKREVDAFSSVYLPNVMFTTTDSTYRIAVMDLSIYRLSPSKNTATSQMIRKMLKLLEFQPYKAPEYLLKQVNELQCEVDNLQARLVLGSKPTEKEKSSQQNELVLTKRLTGLTNDLVEHDRCQLNQLMPVLQRQLTDLSQALTNCLRVKDLIQEWWEQPAQNTVPWVKVDDKSLQQWKDKWTVTIAQLRKPHVK